jgi:hypothetical protein
MLSDISDADVIALPSQISLLFGEIVFIERTHSCGSRFWYAGMVVGPYDIPFVALRTMCINMYRNVSIYNFIALSFIIILITFSIVSTST